MILSAGPIQYSCTISLSNWLFLVMFLTYCKCSRISSCKHVCLKPALHQTYFDYRNNTASHVIQLYRFFNKHIQKCIQVCGFSHINNSFGDMGNQEITASGLFDLKSWQLQYCVIVCGKNILLLKYNAIRHCQYLYRRKKT